jgi:hypothetical protein
MKIGAPASILPGTVVVLIRLWISLALLLAACAPAGASAGGGGATQAPVTIIGQGISKSAPFHLNAGNYAVTWTATPSDAIGCYHEASLQSTATNAPIFGDLLASVILDSVAPQSATTYVYNLAGGDYYIDASSGCGWSFTFALQ